MCYDIQASVQAQLHRAKLIGDKQTEDYIKQNLLPKTDVPIFCKSGFAHPKLLLYQGLENAIPIVAQWGLIPNWTKDEKQKNILQNQTLNARIETLTEKNSFKDSVENRGVLYIDGFFEHHHFNKKAYPFFIFSKTKNKPLPLACIISEWQNGNEKIHTFSIVTTKANQLISNIQNKPSQGEYRMPVILDNEQINIWLDESLAFDKLKEKITTPADVKLSAHPVKHIKGKNIQSDIQGISEEFFYPELSMIIDDILVD